MEPDKTYPLHSDDASQPPSSSSLPTSEQQLPLEPPSKFNETQDGAPQKPATVPWYLQPLTKSTSSPLTSSQTRPFVPRQPLPMNRQDDSPTVTPVSSDVQSMKESVDENSSRPLSQSNSADVQPISRGPSVIQAPPMSPFRSQPAKVPASRGWNMQSEPLSSADRFQMPGQPKTPEYQQALSTSSPKPFSQFGKQETKKPVENGVRKSSALRKIFGIALAILLVAGVGAGIFWLWRTVTAPSATVSPAVVASVEDRLYQAIENSMATSNIHQVYEQTTVANQTSTVKIDATSDFSDPRTPRSYLMYEVNTGQNNAVAEAAGELMVDSTDEYYAKLTKPALFYNGEESVAPKENQWYVVPSNDTRSEVLMDPLGARASINTSLGEFPVGNFSEEDRQQLIRYIKDQKVYEIVSSEQVEIDGKKMTSYKLTLNMNALNELNRRVFTVLGGNSDEMPVEFTQSEKQSTEVWITDDTTRIAKIKIERESSSNSDGQVVKEATTVMHDYPDDVSKINKPESAKAPTWSS